MKIFITDNINLGIDGFETLPVVQGSIMLGKIPRNGCEFILIKNCLDKIKDDVLQEIVSKMRKDGELSISGHDIKSINRQFYTRQIDKKQFMDLVLDKKNLYSSDEIVNKLKELKLTIVSSTLEGTDYDIKAIRARK